MSGFAIGGDASAIKKGNETISIRRDQLWKDTLTRNWFPANNCSKALPSAQFGMVSEAIRRWPVSRHIVCFRIDMTMLSRENARMLGRNCAI